jgi:biotin carboxylase
LPGNEIPDVPFPCVVKPREGVASEDVVFARDAAELSRTCADIWRRRPEPLVVEEFLTGDLHTLETIGDASGTQVVGGFRTTLSPLPYFVEQSLVFDAAPPAGQVDAVLAQLAALGVGFGACHTEYVVDGDRVRIIEVNYRAIGDQCDLLLADLTGAPLFEHILRAHLGEPLRTLPKPANTARVDYPCADTSGRLVAAPGPMDVREGGVRLTYRPLRDIGTYRDHTNTNRDYLGVLRTIGADEAIVAKTAEEFLAGLCWDIRP